MNEIKPNFDQNLVTRPVRNLVTKVSLGTLAVIANYKKKWPQSTLDDFRSLAIV